MGRASSLPERPLPTVTWSGLLLCRTRRRRRKPALRYPPGPKPVRMPDAARAGPFDARKLQRLMAETAEIQDWLSVRQLADESIDPAHPVEVPRETRSSGATASHTLDRRHAALLRELLQRPSWSLADPRAVTSREGLMPLACVARLNEWATDTYGDLILEVEGEQTVNVNTNLKQKLQL